MNTIVKSAALVAAFTILPLGATAGQRYATPPPVTLSPDLTSAWTLQITPRKASRADKWLAKRPRSLKRLKQKTYRTVKPARRVANKTHRSGVVTASIRRKNTKLRASINPNFKSEVIAHHCFL